MAWVGDFIFSIGQAMWAGFCVNCPESPDTMMTDLREIGPTYYFSPPRVTSLMAAPTATPSSVPATTAARDMMTTVSYDSAE